MNKRLLPTVDELVVIYDQKNWREIDEAHYQVVLKYGIQSLVPLLITACSSVKSFKGRKTILFYLLPHVRSYPALLDLALLAINDRSQLVREEALGIVAYSLEDRALPLLQSHLSHPDPITQASVLASIDAIKNKNHHLFLDRDHTGNTRWVVRER